MIKSIHDFIIGFNQYKTLRNKKVGSCQKAKGIISDKIIHVIKDRKTKETLELRMITFEFYDSNNEYQKFSLLSNRFDFTSDEIADIYRERWNIEVMFYWIKTFLKVKHWISRSKNGVMIQLFSALIAYLLVLIARMGSIMNYNVMRDYVHNYSGLLFNFLAQSQKESFS